MLSTQRLLSRRRNESAKEVVDSTTLAPTDKPKGFEDNAWDVKTVQAAVHVRARTRRIVCTRPDRVQ